MATRRRFAATCATTIATVSLWAQSAPEKKPGAAPAAEPEQTIELSPFVVSVGQDTGYVAQDTLSGTRTRTPLKDIAGAVSVFTTDLISDLGATSEKDIMAYSASAVPEVDDQSINVRGNGIGGPGFQYRIRGQSASRTRNYFDALAPSDTYNIGRYEEARGPNAILFGMGGAGGIVNQTTKRANLTRRQSEAAVTAGSHEFYRGEIDHNQVLVPSKLALRFNAMAEDRDSWRPHEFARQQRGHLAGTFAFSPTVKLHADVEFGSMHNSNSRNFGAADALSQWLDSGRPTLTGSTANAARGIAVSANQQRVTIVTNDRTAHNFQQTLASTTDATRRGAMIVDQSLVPNAAFLQGPGADRNFDFDSQTVFLELQPTRNLFIEFAADWQSSSEKRYDYNGLSFELFGEPAQQYREGTPNPYVGNFYFDMNWILKGQEEERRTYRATAAYTLDKGKWGRHNLTFMAQENRADHLQHNQVFALLGAPFNASPFNARNLVTTRHYITNLADVGQYAVGDWRDVPSQINVVMNPGAAPSTFNTGWLTNGGNGLSESWTIIRSYLASTQSYFFQDRLVASFGYRRDEREAFARPNTTDPSGLFIIDYSKINRGEEVATQSSLGLVFHATPWMSVLYNQSQNAEAGGGARLIPDGSEAPLSRGKGRDAGLMFTLLKGKLFARVAYFETSATDENKAFGVLANTSVRNDRILDTMVTDGLLTTAQADARRFTGNPTNNDLLDRKTTGYELNVTANPTTNWRIILSGSQGKSVESNMLKRTTAVMPALLQLWQSARQSSVTAGTTTVAREIVDFQVWYDSTTAIEGVGSLGDREWQAKFFNRYTLNEGLLKGAYIGGGWRYQSAPIIGANTAAGIFFKGESTTELDLVAGYQTRAPWFGRRARLSLQLNGNDLLQRRDWLSVRRDSTGILSIIRTVDPASYKLQAKISF